MNLKEAITYLEEYYEVTSEEFYSEETNELRSRVEQAFRFTEDELEQALSDHPQYAFVRFSSLEYYEYDTMAFTEKKNYYKSAIVPRVIADIFSEYFQNAILYKTWWQFEEAIEKLGIGSRQSYELELMDDLLHKTEDKGYGYIVSEITQQKNYMRVEGEEYQELGKSYSWKSPIGSFEKNENDNLKFKILLPDLEDVFMSLASKKFEKSENLERKRTME